MGILSLLAVAVVVSGTVMYKHYRLAEHLRLTPQESAVPVVEVRSGTLERTLRLTGTTAAKATVRLHAPYLRGRRGRGGGGSDFRLTLRELATSGTRVKAGDTVAVFDRQYMLDRLDSYEAELAASEANVKKLAAQLSLERLLHLQDVRVARSDMERAALDLRTAPVRSAIEAALLHLAYEEDQARYAALVEETKSVDISLAAQMKAAQLELRSNEVEFRRAENNAERLVARAPRDGIFIVRQIFRPSGLSTIRAGDDLRPGHLFGQVVDLRSMIIDAHVNQVDVRKLHIGDSARAHFDAFPGLELQARLSSIGSIARNAGWRANNYVKEVPVRFEIQGASPRVMPDLSASVDVVLERKENTAIVPREVIFKDQRNGDWHAFVEDGSGWERRVLELGPTSYTRVAVLSGLSSGEVVAAEPPLGLGATSD